MPQEIQNKAEYIVIFISEFARRFGLSAAQAYRYLNRYKAIDFLDEQYNVAHRAILQTDDWWNYSKGYATPDSDIDVAVIVPTYGGSKFEISKNLWRDVRNVSFLIEPVLMAEDRWSPLYDDVMRTGVPV